jgi:hypothetical protein
LIDERFPTEDEMKRICSALALVIFLAPFGLAEGGKGALSLEVQGAYGFPNLEGTDSGGLVPIAYSQEKGPGGREVGSTWGGAEAKAALNYQLVSPAFVGDGPLTMGNNLALDFAFELSPVSLNANFSATLTPIAFLKLAAGAGVGTGWDIGFVGLGLNEAGTIESQSFGGAVYRAWVGGTFQFDLAAVLPGEWNHAVVLASPKVVYQAYSAAADDEAWLWEADKGMNFNGLKLYGNYLLGYQPPLAMDLAGILLQTEGWLGSVADKSTMASKGWGSDYTYLVFGPLFDFKLGETASLAVLPQFKTGIKWSDATKWQKDFRDRSYDGSYAYFYRLAFDYTLKL